MQLQDPRIVTDVPPRDFRQADGLVLTTGVLLWGNAPTVSSSQGFPNSHNGWLPITFQYQGILPSPRMPPSL